MDELRILKDKTPKGLWTEDIDAFMEELAVSVYIRACHQRAGCVEELWGGGDFKFCSFIVLSSP